MTRQDPQDGQGGGGPVHWLEGLRCPDCRWLNASWLFYARSDGPCVECEHCGAVRRVLGPDDTPQGSGEPGREVA